jgi:hypothetical protein
MWRGMEGFKIGVNGGNEGSRSWRGGLQDQVRNSRRHEPANAGRDPQKHFKPAAGHAGMGRMPGCNLSPSVRLEEEGAKMPPAWVVIGRGAPARGLDCKGIAPRPNW